MSAEDVETIRSGIEAYNRGDAEGLIASADPDVRFVPLRSLLEGGEYRGHQGLRQFLADMAEDWAEREIVIEDLRDLGNGVLVLGDFHAVGRTSGIEIHYPVAWMCQMREGRLSGMRAFTDQAAALAELDAATAEPSRLEAGMRQIADVFNRRGPEVVDDPSFIELVRSQVHAEFEGSSVGVGKLLLPGTYRGVEGYLEFVRSWNDVWSEISYEIERFTERGDRGAAAVRVRGHGRGSGVEVDILVGWSFEVRDELLFRWRVHQDVDEAFAAAGIVEPAAAD